MLALAGVNLALGGRSREKLEALEEGIRASEVRLEDPGRVGPEQCAESVCRLLANPPDASAGGFTVRRVPEA